MEREVQQTREIATLHQQGAAEICRSFLVVYGNSYWVQYVPTKNYQEDVVARCLACFRVSNFTGYGTYPIID